MRIKKLKPGFQSLTREKARVIAHLIGDGYHGQSGTDYNLKYEVSDLELLDQFEDDLLYVYGLKPTRGTNPSGKTGKPIPYVRLRSKAAYEDLLLYASYYSKDWEIKDQILVAPLDVKVTFLSALFDDEGSVIPQGKKAIIRLYSINLDGLKQIQEILSTDFSIFSKMVPGFGLKRNVYALTIRDIVTFSEKIGFSLKRKIDRLKEFL